MSKSTKQHAELDEASADLKAELEKGPLRSILSVSPEDSFQCRRYGGHVEVQLTCDQAKELAIRLRLDRLNPAPVEFEPEPEPGNPEGV
jgi:hypothetical protein